MRDRTDARRSRAPAWLARATLLSLGLLTAEGAAAQVATDGSVGARRTLGGPVIRISPDLGARSGANLFHSFSAFNVNSGEAALFGVPSDVDTVIGRVTSGRVSTIDGTVSFVQPGTFIPTGANFWFFNPAGVAIGPNAQFRTNGSLHLSAGDAALFADGSRFGAAPEAALTLTSAQPSAFSLGAAPGAITLTGSRLSAEGDVLSLSGGRLVFDGGSVVSPAGADIVLVAGGAGETAAVGAPGVRPMRSGVVTLSGGALSAGAAVAPGGDVRVSAGALRVLDGGVIETQSTGAAAAGDVRVAAGEIEIRAGGRIRSQAGGDGDAGDVSVTSFDRLFASRSGTSLVTGISSVSGAGAAGNAGAVVIRGGDVILRDAARIVSNTSGQGDAARVDMRVRRVDGRGGSQIGSGALDNRDLATGAGGAAGEVSIVASEEIRFSGFRRDSPLVEPEPSGVFSGTEGARSGAGGLTTIRSPLIVLTDEAEIGSETFNDSDAAGLVIRGGEMRLSGGAEVTTTGRSTGDAGAIRIDLSGPLSVRGGAEIASRSSGGGRPSTVSSAVSGPPVASTGAAGRIVISAASITLSGGGSVTTDSASADGGSIRLASPGLIIADNANVTTSVGASTGNGGDVNVRSGLLVLRDGARIAATADQGDGGFVTLNSGTSFFDAAASIEVGSASGQNGVIVINGAVGTQSSETDPPPAEFLNRFALIDDFCVAAVTGGSALTVEGPRGGPGGDAAPALFGDAIPYPGGSRGAAAQPGAEASSEIRAIALARSPRCGAANGR